MKATVSVPQLIAVMVIVVVLVFIATYASITLGGNGGGGPKPPTISATVEVVEFRERRPSTGLNRSGYFESEVQKTAHYDFWFENKTKEPVQVRLERVGCKCTTVDLALLPGDARTEPKEQLDSRARAGLEWQVIPPRESNKSLPVPAGAVGGIRLNWKGEKVGSDNMRAEVIFVGGGISQSVQLEIPVMYADAIRVSAVDYPEEAGRPDNEASVGTLVGGDSKTVKFLAWSSSRSDFKLTVIPPPQPGVTCSEPVKLTEEECKQLGESRGTNALCGYRLSVTVAERGADGRQMDLGFFKRRVTLESDDAKSEAVVLGFIQGEVTIGVVADRNAFDLQTFNAPDGASKTLELVTDKGDLELVLATVADLADRKEKPLPYPDFIQAPVLEDVTMKQKLTNGKAWTLTVTVPPNAWNGQIPRDSAVYLKIKRENPRFIRIPIVGNASVK